jgi:hypothetical protein
MRTQADATTVDSGEPAEASASVHESGLGSEDPAPPTQQVNGNGLANGEAPQTTAAAEDSEDLTVAAEESEDVEIVKESDGTVSYKFKKLVDMVKNLASPKGEAPQASGGSSRGERALVQSPQGPALSGPRYAKGLGRRSVQASAESSGEPQHMGMLSIIGLSGEQLRNGLIGTLQTLARCSHAYSICDEGLFRPVVASAFLLLLFRRCLCQTAF